MYLWLKQCQFLCQRLKIQGQGWRESTLDRAPALQELSRKIPECRASIHP